MITAFKQKTWKLHKQPLFKYPYRLYYTELSEIEKKIELYKRSNNLTNIEAEAKNHFGTKTEYLKGKN